MPFWIQPNKPIITRLGLLVTMTGDACFWNRTESFLVQQLLTQVLQHPWPPSNAVKASTQTEEISEIS